jgi:plastocyanin
MRRSLTGSLVVCVAAAAFTAGALVVNDDVPGPAAVAAPGATGGNAYRGPAAGPAAAPTGAAPATLTIQGLAFGPVTAGRGGRVLVQNRDGVAHTVTADTGAFDTGQVGPKATVTLTAPATPGNYRFTCLIHPQMSGTLVVR